MRFLLQPEFYEEYVRTHDAGTVVGRADDFVVVDLTDGEHEALVNDADATGTTIRWARMPIDGLPGS